jgi:hypothetical protein
MVATGRPGSRSETMNTHIRTTATVVAGIATGAAIVLTGTSTVATTSDQATTSGQKTETMVLAFPWVGGHQRFIDTGRKGIGPGDLFLGVGMPILDNGTGAELGTSDAVELIVSGRHDGTVTSQSTLRLPGGHIELDGVVRHTDQPFRITVTGGTGRYLGVGGQLTLLKSDKHRKVEVEKLELVR